MQKTTPERPYHHGNLRRSLIDTALEVMRQERNWQFTLREIARRAGVSHAAPYKHFPDKGALLTALALIGFDQLRAALIQAQSNAGGEPREALLPMARAYIDFGVDNPALYRLMFGAESGYQCDVHLGESAISVFNTVMDVLARGQAEGVFRRRPVRDYATACWSLLHGMTMLSIDGLLMPEKVGLEPLKAAFGSLMEGIASEGM
ncbi:TetR/AcrR family transcriptional regulator [Mesorhizobium sp. M1060]|uniref:TetR/AcrR family transcriptional regulator n=1 Tax=unclassified Mesorhizobium TaxID=325217 RepID=UPI0003CED20B|nr:MULTISPECIES: TetR/AcrR family transcriptional regulator [unclassified Mesorhizobium]ESY16409.1 TetR family transcriptional regulator [Mesorhizobium sp. LNJC394B00]ESZ04050.1 TetR family transcriptional regulator [Mesorhizobium sp. L2C089B000]ESZ74102.1 TetR family transcriptional regulator [Mesorhizobium sp. L103C105A0]WJI49687.1 TetR/AcrR family transcriptional regulator [Mesorhizobium sp. C089B]